VRSDGVGDEVRGRWQQGGGPGQARAQVLLILSVGKELVSNPVHGRQHAHGFDIGDLVDVGGAVAVGIVGENLRQVPSQVRDRGIHDWGVVLCLRRCSEPLAQVLDKQVPVTIPPRFDAGHDL
jgi:hypothetical protein